MKSLLPVAGGIRFSCSTPALWHRSFVSPCPQESSDRPAGRRCETRYLQSKEAVS